MKKRIIIASAALAALTSCSSKKTLTENWSHNTDYLVTGTKNTGRKAGRGLKSMWPGATNVEKTTRDFGEEIKGVRYYMPKPYLFVSQSVEKKDLTARIVYLPNFSEQYALSGRLEKNAQLTDGWQLKIIDSKTPDNSGLQKNLDSNIQALVTGSPDMTPGIYELVINEAGRLDGFRKLKVLN